MAKTCITHYRLYWRNITNSVSNLDNYIFMLPKFKYQNIQNYPCLYLQFCLLYWLIVCLPLCQWFAYKSFELQQVIFRHLAHLYTCTCISMPFSNIFWSETLHVFVRLSVRVGNFMNWILFDRLCDVYWIDWRHRRFAFWYFLMLSVLEFV